MKNLQHSKLIRIASIFIFLFSFSAVIHSQTPQYYNLNSGTSANSFPFNMSGGKAVNSIFLAGEFANPTPLPSGMQITRVYFRTGTAATRVYNNLQILFAQSTITTLTTGTFYAGPYDTVYFQDTTNLVSTSGGWMPVTLKHPFPYDPTKSLITFVGVCSYTGTGTTVYNSTLTGVRRVWSVGGCPFAPYSSGDASMVNFGVDVVPVASLPLPPVLVYPANNATGIPTSFTFVWNKSATTSTTNYWWQLTTDTSSLANLQNDSTLTDSTKSISGLTNITNYFWRVKSKNTAGWGSFSGWFKFTTVFPVPSAPTLISPPNGGTLGTPQILKWSLVQYASSYRLQITTDSTFITITAWDTSGVADTSVLVPSGKLIFNTWYYWRVNATNVSGTGPYSTQFKFKTLADPTALSMSNFIPVICPKFMTSGTSTRLPVAVRGTIQGLIPNKTYRYYNLLAVSTDLGTTALGAGVIMLIDSNGTFIYTSLGSLTTAGQYLTFVANAAGTFTGWFGNLNSGNARFTAGNYVYPAVCIGDSVGNVIARYAMNDSIQVLAFNTSAGANYGTGVYGISLGLPKNIITLYDNNAGTGKPLSATWIEQTGVTLPSVVQYYADSVNPYNGRWGSILPNSLASGLQRVEQRAINNGVILTFNTSSTGLWPSGANTVNPAGGTTAIRLTLADEPLMSTPVLISPTNGSIDLVVTPTLTWNSSFMATSYRVQISTDSAGFGTLAYDSAGLAAVTITVPSGKLNKNTKYYWRVNAANSVGSTLWSTVWNFTTIPNLPSAPILVSPPNYGGGSTPITFVWRKAVETLSAKTNATGKRLNKFAKDNLLTISNYWFEYTTDSTFATVTLRDSSITDTITIKGMATGLYWWRVKAKNQIGWGPFSIAWHIYVYPPIPGPPFLVSPINGSLGVSLTPLLDWTDVLNATSYHIQVSADSNFITTAYDTSGVAISQVNVPAGKLTGLTKYYWRVNATNAGGTGPWSVIWNFITLQNLILNLKVYLEGFWGGTTQVPDTAKVYLANYTSPYAFVDSATVILSAAGTAAIIFTKAPNANYHIAVKHRNHLETWSSVALPFFTNVQVNYDFTTAAGNAYGNMMKLVGSVWVFYVGDANQDGSIDASDVAIFILQYGNIGYLSCDFNGDNSVDALDVPFMIANYGLTKVVPTLIYESIEIRKEKQMMKRKELNEMFKKINSKNIIRTN